MDTQTPAPQTPNVEPKKKRGGVRPNSGRPKGARGLKTILRDRALDEFNMRVYKMTDKLLNATAILALGTHKIITITLDDDGKKHIKTIRDEKHMQELLDTGVYGKDYLIVEGTLPEWKAAEYLLNRAYGKPKESIDMNVEVFSLKGLAERRKVIEMGKVDLIEEEHKALSAQGNEPI